MGNPWKQRKVGELGEVVTGSTPSTTNSDYYSAEGFPWVTPTDISTNIISDSSTKLSDLGKQVARVVPANTLLITCIASIGKNALLTVEGSFNQQINGLIPDRDFDPYFLLTESTIWSEQLRKQAGSGTMQIVNKTEFKKLKTMIPDVCEQEKIGNLFRDLDSLITLHQRQLDLLKKQKEGLLQKMFPKPGSDVPEIRFPGFTEPWKQRELGEIVERVTRKNLNFESELPLTISAQHGLINQNEYFDKRIASANISGYYLIKNGEFAYNKSTSNDAPWGAIRRLDRYQNGVLSTLYIVFRIISEAKVNSNFLVSYFEGDGWHKEVQAVAAEGARNHGLLNITPGDFFKIKLYIPQTLKEQKLIGELFQMLDDLITLHQRKPKL